MRKFIALAALILSFTMATPAQAQNVTTHPTAVQLNWHTYNWWVAERAPNYAGCNPYGLQIYLHDYATSDWGCQIWLSRSLWNAAHSGPMDGYRISMRDALCSQFIHERGHSAGLPHASGWVMDPNVLWPVAMCQRWARG